MSFWKLIRYKVVEVDRPRKISTLEGKELREALRALQNHPAMGWLFEHLKNQRFLLESRLRDTPFADIKDVHFVQSGVFWCGWLERELRRLTQEPAKAELPALDAEEAAFKEIDLQLERVGVEAATNGST